MTVPLQLRHRGWRFWGKIGFQSAAIICILAGMLAGRPPAIGQSDAVSNQHRDDQIENLKSAQDTSRASIKQQWEQINAMKATMQQMQIDAAAGTSTSNKVATGEIVALLASIGMQVKGGKKRKSEEDD